MCAAMSLPYWNVNGTLWLWGSGLQLLLSSRNDWRVFVSGSLLPHMGKHAMLVLANEDGPVLEPM